MGCYNTILKDHVSDISHVEIKKVGFHKNKAGDRTHDLCGINFYLGKTRKLQNLERVHYILISDL